MFMGPHFDVLCIASNLSNLLMVGAFYNTLQGGKKMVFHVNGISISSAWEDLNDLLCGSCLLETGMHFTRKLISQDTIPMPMQAPHCPQLSLSVLANFFRSSTIST